MRNEAKYPLTYFSHRTSDELDVIIEDLRTSLTKEEIVKLFIENFDAEKLYDNYHIAVTDKFVEAIKRTSEYAIDMEILINYIFSKF